MKRNIWLKGAFSCGLIALLAACGGGSLTNVTNPAPPAAPQGSVFVVGTDAPLGSVLAFRITFTGLNASDGTNSVSLITQPQEVEFARLNGLRTLLDLRSVPAGTYTSITAMLATPVISFLDTTTTPPSVQTLNGTLTQSSVTVQLPQPLVVTDSGLVGLFLDFRIRNSLQVDANGQMTGAVNPTLALRAISPDAPEAMIDELRGGVVSVDVAAGTFVMQGPHGRNLTVVTDSQTQWEPGESLSTLTTTSVVEVSGHLQRQTLSLRAAEVEVLSRDRFLLGGLITDVRPPTGPATEFDLLVRTELPDLASAQPGQISAIPLNGNERFGIHHMLLPIGSRLFNAENLVAGQRVAVGGALDNSTNPPSLDARRVILHRQGLEGGWIPGSTRIISGNVGGFDFHAAGLQGNVLGRAVRVHTSERTRFINLAGLADLTGANPIRLRVVGLVLKEPAGPDAVVVAHTVEKMN